MNATCDSDASPSTQLLNDVAMSARRAKPRHPTTASDSDEGKDLPIPLPGKKRMRPSRSSHPSSEPRVRGVDVYELPSEDEASPVKKKQKVGTAKLKQAAGLAGKKEGTKGGSGAGRKLKGRGSKESLRLRLEEAQKSVAVGEKEEEIGKGNGRPMARKDEPSQARRSPLSRKREGPACRETLESAQEQSSKLVAPSEDVAAVQEGESSNPPQPAAKRERGRLPGKGKGNVKGKKGAVDEIEAVVENEGDEDIGDVINVAQRAPESVLVVQPKTPTSQSRRQSNTSAVVYSNKSNKADDADRTGPDIDEVLNGHFGAGGGEGREEASTDSPTLSRTKVKLTKVSTIPRPTEEEAGDEADSEGTTNHPPKTSKKLKLPSQLPLATEKSDSKGGSKDKPLANQPSLSPPPPPEVAIEEDLEGQETTLVGEEEPEGRDAFEEPSSEEASDAHSPSPRQAVPKPRHSSGKTSHAAAKAYEVQLQSEGADGLLDGFCGPLERLQELEKHLEAERNLINKYIVRTSGLNTLSRVGKEEYLTQIKNIIKDVRDGRIQNKDDVLRYLDKTLKVMQEVRMADEKFIEEMLIRQSARSRGQTECIKAIENAFESTSYKSMETANQRRTTEKQARKYAFEEGIYQREAQKRAQRQSERCFATVRARRKDIEDLKQQKAARLSIAQVPSRRITAPSPLAPSRHTTASNLQEPSCRATTSTTRTSAAYSTAADTRVEVDGESDHHNAPTPAPVVKERPWTDEEFNAIFEGMGKHRGKDRWHQIMLDNPQVLRYRTADDCRERAIDIKTVLQEKGDRLGTRWERV